VRFDVLRPLAVTDDHDAVIVIRQRRQRQFVAVLVLHPGQPLTTDRIADLVWGMDLPPSGAGSVRTLAWSIRREQRLAARLTHDDRGYQIEVRPGELDVNEFRQLADRGLKALVQQDADSAVGLLRQALCYWREPVLADVPDTLAMSPLRARLLNERQATRDAVIDARLILGQHHQLSSELRQHVAERPEHEPTWAQLMLALYRCGMRAEAVETYARMRHVLGEEYGIEPGPSLRRLHLQILHDDRALSAYAPRQISALPRR
jgi:DNA-binding SARP family transcriptional activator